MNNFTLNTPKYCPKNGVHHILTIDITKKLQENFIKNKYDIILFPEIIEHIHDMTTTFNNIKCLMKPNSELIISTPNAFALGNIFRMLFGIEKNHPEHLSYYSFLTLENLLNRFGFIVKDFYYSKSSIIDKNIFVKLVQSLLLKIFPQLNSGVILVLRIK